jgi:hypothetical protein
MTYNNAKHSKFNCLVRIRRKNLEWLRQNKKAAGCETIAGYLDIIINHYKNLLEK